MGDKVEKITNKAIARMIYQMAFRKLNQGKWRTYRIQIDYLSKLD